MSAKTLCDHVHMNDDQIQQVIESGQSWITNRDMTIALAKEAASKLDKLDGNLKTQKVFGNIAKSSGAVIAIAIVTIATFPDEGAFCIAIVVMLLVLAAAWYVAKFAKKREIADIAEIHEYVDMVKRVIDEDKRCLIDFLSTILNKANIKSDSDAESKISPAFQDTPNSPLAPRANEYTDGQLPVTSHQPSIVERFHHSKSLEKLDAFKSLPTKGHLAGPLLFLSDTLGFIHQLIDLGDRNLSKVATKMRACCNTLDNEKTDFEGLIEKLKEERTKRYWKKVMNGIVNRVVKCSCIFLIIIIALFAVYAKFNKD